MQSTPIQPNEILVALELYPVSYGLPHNPDPPDHIKEHMVSSKPSLLGVSSCWCIIYTLWL